MKNVALDFIWDNVPRLPQERAMTLDNWANVDGQRIVLLFYWSRTMSRIPHNGDLLGRGASGMWRKFYEIHVGFLVTSMHIQFKIYIRKQRKHDIK